MYIGLRQIPTPKMIGLASGLVLIGMISVAVAIMAGDMSRPGGDRQTADGQDEVNPHDSRAALPDDEAAGFWNWQLPTMGGQQFWSDVQALAGWRIQRNALTGHHRLLDEDDYRHTWGSLEHCQSVLDEKQQRYGLQPYRGKVVIVLHGLMRTRNAMADVVEAIEATGEFQVIDMEYASGRDTIDQHADDLASIIAHLGDEVTEIYFVGHSMGNLVVRHYLHDHTDPETGQQGDPRIRRMVMLAPPNQGSQFAQMLKNSVAFSVVTGPGGADLSRHWDEVAEELAAPQFEFGIIAGGDLENPWFSNPALPGADDFTVTVEETYLPGARDHQIFPVLHSSIIHDEDVLAATVRFLQHGYLVSEEQRRPIPARSPSPE